MRKTGEAIEEDILMMVRNSPLATEINGGIYKFGLRPRDSQQEDIIVRFVTGFEGQIQRGVVVVSIYVPNIDHQNTVVKDFDRCRRLSDMANDWFYSLNASRSSYKFSLAQTITTVEDEALRQHFVSVRLQYNLATI